jgi:hypothetical protein
MVSAVGIGVVSTRMCYDKEEEYFQKLGMLRVTVETNIHLH